MKNLVFLAVSLTLAAISGSAFASTTPHCGKYPYNPAHTCCYHGKMYSQGWITKTHLRCALPTSLHWEKIS